MSLLVLFNSLEALEGGTLGRYDYSRLAATAARMIQKFGQAGQLKRPTSTGPAHNPAEGDPLLFPAKFVITAFKSNEIDGTRVLATDKKALVAAASLATTPVTSDLLVDEAGVAYRIAGVETLKPATTPLVYKLQVRH